MTKKKSKRKHAFGQEVLSGYTDEFIKELTKVWYDRIPDPDSRRIGNTNVLKVQEGDGMLSFQMGTLMTGWAGFKRYLETDPMCYYFEEVWYNGMKLNKEQEKQFWDQTIEWIEEEKQIDKQETKQEEG